MDEIRYYSEAKKKYAKMREDEYTTQKHPRGFLCGKIAC